MRVWGFASLLIFFSITDCNPAATDSSTAVSGDLTSTALSITAGGENAGACKQPARGCRLIVLGNQTNRSAYYDPITDTFIPGPDLSAVAKEGAHGFPILRGPHAGKTMVVHGNNTTGTSIYEKESNSFLSGPNLTAAAEVGAHAFAITSGIQVGKTLVVHGNGSATTSIYDPILNSFIVGPTTSAASQIRAHSFSITTGPKYSPLIR